MRICETDKNVMLSHTYWCGWGDVCNQCSFYNIWFGIEWFRYNTKYGGGGYPLEKTLN